MSTSNGNARANGKGTSDRPQRRPTPQQQAASLLDRLPPQNLEAEVGVCGSAILLPDVIDDVLGICKPDHFYDDANRTVFQMMANMHAEGKKIDPTLLVNRLKESGDFDGIGGAAYLSKIVNAVPNAAHAKYYAEIVRDKAALRQVILGASEILAEAYDDAMTPTEIITKAEASFAKVAENAFAASLDAVDFNEALMASIERMDARANGEDVGLKCGISGIDDALNGLRPKTLTILAGRPSQGKTACALGIAIHAAKSNHGAVLFVSLEMSKEELCERALAAETKIDYRRMVRGDLTPEQRGEIIEASAELGQLKLFIDDSSTRSVSEIAAASRRIKRKHGLCLLVIDYLQLIDPDNTKDNRQEQIAKISRRLKQLSKQLDIPVLCLAQLNRQAEQTKDNRPRLSHLRESGAIEQDADAVMFVHRPLYYLYKTPTDGSGEEAEIILAKARNGPARLINMLWFAHWMSWQNPAQQHHASDYSAPYADNQGSEF